MAPSTEKSSCTEIRYDIAMATAKRLLGITGHGCSPHRAKLLGQLAFAVLDAMYESEERLANAPPTRQLCPWCIRVDAGAPGRQLGSGLLPALLQADLSTGPCLP